MANELTINPKTIVSELQKMRGQIEAALPKHMTPDRMARIALTALRVTPQLFHCTPESFFGSIIAASQLGLEPGVNGQCYLIPYGNTCTLVPGWKGLMDLVSRSGRASAWTGAVRPGDKFEFQLGSNPKLVHEPGDDDLGEFTHVYAVGWVRDAQWPIIEVWSRAKVMKHLRKYNKVGDRHYALQGGDNLEMYGRKVALLQVIKYLPSSIELRDAAALDVSAAEGKQALTIDMAFAGDLQGGGPSEELAESEVLMEKLDWAEEKRKMFRQNYAQKITDGVAYLRSEIEKLGRGSQPTLANAPEGQPAVQASGRRRGRAAKAEDKAQDEQQAPQKNAEPPKDEQLGTEGQPPKTITEPALANWGF